MKRVSTILITAALIAGMVGCDGYTPPSEDLEIRDWYDLDAVRENLEGHHRLMNDLDSTTAGYEELASPTANEGSGWQPISFGTEGIDLFTGTLDGQGYEIRDLFINHPGMWEVGLFGIIYEGGQIEDIGVVDIYVIGDEVVGGLVGACYGTVTNSYSTGSITGYDGTVGGLVGWNQGIVSNSYSSGNVTCEDGDGSVGGLVGLNEGTVSNSHSSGDVTGSMGVGGLVGANVGIVSNSYSTGSVTGYAYIGGLMGHNGGTVSDSHYSGNVTGYGFVGGLMGQNVGIVSNSYSTGSVTGNGLVGGLVGYNYDGTVSNSYATGDVTGVVIEEEPDTGIRVGGLVGLNEGVITNSYSTGSVTGNLVVGGLVGSSYGTVSNSYSTGSVTGNLSVGGLVGDRSGTISNSYYNYDEVLINGQNIITIGALFGVDFEEWLANDKFLDVNDRLSQESGYYVISDVNDFKQLLAFGQDSSLKFRLKNDLDFATEPSFYIPYLAGEFDGNGHKISNLSFNFDFVSQVGLFGHLAPSGNVTDLAAENVNITACIGVGGLVGKNYGTVSNSYSTGSVTGGERVGGLLGWSYGTVSNSYATGSVTGGEYVGGLVGRNAGGFVSSSYSTGSVTGNSSVGGLLGSSYGTVSNSFWDTETSGQNTSAGGTGKNTTEMQDITTFSGAGWDIIAVALNETNPAYIWNIVTGVTYPFLSWQPI